MSTPHLAEHLFPIQTKHSQILKIPIGNSQLLWTLADETSGYFIFILEQVKGENMRLVISKSPLTKGRKLCYWS